MRILFIAPRFHTNQFQAVKTLQDNNHEVFFHVAAIGTTEDHSLLKPVRFDQNKLSLLIEKFRGMGGVNRKYYFPKFWQYFKAFRRLRPDVVIIRNPYRFFSVLAAVYALLLKRKIIFYTLEELFRSKTRKVLLKQKLTMRLFRAAWMTPIMGDENGGFEKLAHMYYVPLPITIKPVRSNQRHNKVPRILMIGKYHQERKKHLLFVDAISMLRKKYTFKVTIVGECTREQQLLKFDLIKEAIEKLGLSDIIDLQKNIPFNEMETLYTSHDLFVLPAINEPYGVTVTEALGYGLPVICTDTCGAKYNIKDGENGYIVKSNSLDELVKALEIMLSSSYKLNGMGERSYNYVANNLSGNAFYNRFSHLLMERFQVQFSDSAFASSQKEIDFCID